MSLPARVLLLLSLTTAASAQEITSGTIAAISIERTNVFDPRVKGEDWWGFRIANRIHILSREPMLRRELLLKEGQPYDALRALESERNLRSLGIFRKAEIRTTQRPNGRVDINLRTQDAWTTIVFLSVGTEGGDNLFAYGAEENNLLGRGKSVAFRHSQNGPRMRNDLRYTDPRFWGTRMSLTPLYSRTHRGDTIGVDLTRPFFSLESPHAEGLGWSRSVDETILYQNGTEFSKFVQRSRTVSAALGRRLPNDEIFVQRVELGWHSQRDQFEALPETRFGTLPLDREWNGPTAAYTWTVPRYVKETYVNKMERVEDFNLGNELALVGGFMGKAFASDRDRWIYNVSDQQGVAFGPGRFALVQAGVSGRLGNGGKPENAILYANANLVWKTLGRLPQTWVAHFEGSTARNLDGEHQIILGGNTGLRGYKNNAFTGGKAVLANIENRFFLPGEHFHIVRFGGAVFFDSGAVVPEGSGLSFKRFKSDVGVGLRMSSTRSQSGGIVRIDFAYALNSGPGGGRWVLSVRGRQAFDLFNSASKRIKQSPGSRLLPAVAVD